MAIDGRVHGIGGFLSRMSVITQWSFHKWWVATIIGLKCEVFKNMHDLSCPFFGGLLDIGFYIVESWCHGTLLLLSYGNVM